MSNDFNTKLKAKLEDEILSAVASLQHKHNCSSDILNLAATIKTLLEAKNLLTN